jgi:capsule polysaccharide export protein KpsE/RkpR
MREKAPLAVPETSTRGVIAPAQPDFDAIPTEEREHEFARPRVLAGLQLVWGNRQFIFRSTVAGLLLSVLIAFLIPKRFQSTSRLMPPDQGSSGMGIAMLAAASGSIGAQVGSGLSSIAEDLLGLKSSSDLFIGILQSRTVQDDLISKFELRKVYSDRRMEDAREDLDKRTNLSEDRKSGILTIQVTDNNPMRAAAMAGEYANELNWVVTQLNTSSAHRERVFLEDRLTQVKQDLESAEKNFSEFAAKNTALDIPAQGRAMIEAAANLEGQLIAAQTELQGLKQVYADGNVRVRAAQARADELRQQLEKNLGGKSGDPGTPNGQNRQSLYPSIRELPALGVGYADLYRNTKIREAVFQTLTQEYELAKVQEAKETPSVKVLDPPDIPEKKSYPPRLLIISLGMMLAIAGSVFCVFGKQAWDQTGQEDPNKVLAQEVIHTVRARMPWAGTNGSGACSANGKSWTRSHESKEHSNNDL